MLPLCCPNGHSSQCWINTLRFHHTYIENCFKSLIICLLGIIMKPILILRLPEDIRWWFIFADACECESNVTTYFSGKVKCEKFEVGSSSPAPCLLTADSPMNCPSLGRILTQFFIFYPESTLKEVQQLPLNHPYLGYKAASENIGNVGNLRGTLLKKFKYSIWERGEDWKCV